MKLLNEREKMINRSGMEAKKLSDENESLKNKIKEVSDQCSTKLRALSIERDDCYEKYIESSKNLQSLTEVNKVLEKEVNDIISINKTLQESFAQRPPGNLNRNRNREEGDAQVLPREHSQLLTTAQPAVFVSPDSGTRHVPIATCADSTHRCAWFLAHKCT